MDYENKRLGVKFNILDRMTVRQQLTYASVRDELGLRDKPMYERLWEAAKTIIEGWECETMAINASLDDISDKQSAEIIQWAARAAFGHMLHLEDVPKNS